MDDKEKFDKFFDENKNIQEDESVKKYDYFFKDSDEDDSENIISSSKTEKTNLKFEHESRGIDFSGDKIFSSSKRHDIKENKIENTNEEDIGKTEVFDISEAKDKKQGFITKFFKKNDTDDEETKQKKKGCLVKLIWVCTILVLSIGIGIFLFLNFINFFGLTTNGTANSAIVVDKGDTVSEVAEKLEDADVIDYPWMFKLYSKFKKYSDSSFIPGAYDFDANLSYIDIINKMTTAGAEPLSTVDIVVVDGMDLDKIASLMEENGVCSAQTFIDVAENDTFDLSFVKSIPEESVYYRLEGYLYPDTYNLYDCFDEKTNAHKAIDKMLSNFQTIVINDNHIDQLAQNAGYSLHEVLTLGSIIELEASSASYQDKCSVSAVFHNRLAWTDEPNKLGSSPTANYHGKEKYDTNKSEGLPPGPYCSTTLDCITAALSPTADMTQSYFVTDSSGVYYYMNSYNEFLSKVKSLKKQGKWADK